MEYIVYIAIIVGFLKGITNTQPSFWKGFGEGLASRDSGKCKTSFYYTDRKTGIGMRIHP